MRKKFLLESLQQNVRALQEENEKLKGAIRENLDDADELLAGCVKHVSEWEALTPSSAVPTYLRSPRAAPPPPTYPFPPPQNAPRISGGGASVIASNPNDATTTLDDPDYRLVKALQTAQQNFVISVRCAGAWTAPATPFLTPRPAPPRPHPLPCILKDPSLPDNPIVYASSGFLRLRYALYPPSPSPPL